nr:GFA family protein [uncultured Albidiferax sp.]
MHYPEIPPPWPGSCLCGKVQYTLNEHPLTFYACHCTDCQRRTGGAMRLAMWVHRSALSVSQGQPRLLTFEMGGGRQRRAKACPDCDTRLWAEPADKPHLAALLPGSLHNAREFEPVAHLWTRSALAWVTIPPGVAVFDTKPGPGELVRLWQAAMQQRRLGGAA